MAPECIREGEALTWLWQEEGYRLRLDRFVEKFGVLHAEILVESIVSRNGRAGHVHWSSLALPDTRARGAVIGKLCGQDSKVNWAYVVELCCFEAARLYREGEPMADLSEGAGEIAPRKWLMGKVLPANETSLVYGDGSSGKSLLVQTVALAVRMCIDLPGRLLCSEPCPVIYYDWETNADVIRRRMTRLCAGWMVAVPTMHYVRMSRSLLDSADRMRSDIARLKVGLVVVDSIAFAMPQNLNDADAATKAFAVLRSLNATVLVVHHVSKAAAEQESGPVKPYGSGYFYNGARNAWEVRSRQEGNNLVMSLWHRKDNDGRLLSHPVGMTFSFSGEDGPITVASADISQDPELVAHGGLAFHLRSLLRSGPLTTRELSEATGATLDAVTRALRRTHGVVNLTPEQTGRGKTATWGISVS